MEGQTLIHRTLTVTVRGPINIFFIAGKKFLKIPTNSIALAFFLLRQVLKNIDMPRQNPRHLKTGKTTFECCNSGILLEDLMKELDTLLCLFSGQICQTIASLDLNFSDHND